MKIWTSEHVFSHPWETVVKAATRKYPNPMTTSVIGVDVVERKILANGVLRSHRLLTTDWGLPAWVTKLVGMSDSCHASEHSDIDPAGKTMTLRSRNLTFSNMVSIDEKLVYAPHPEDESKTLLKQEAVITVKGVPMTDYMESLVSGTINSKAGQGRQAMEWVINKIKEESHDLGRAVHAQEEHLRDSLKHLTQTASVATATAAAATATAAGASRPL